MFAVLRSSSDVPLAALVDVAQAFTPRFQVVGPFVLLDASGLSSLFGGADDLSAALQAACPECPALVLASTASTALLLASGRHGRVVVPSGEERAVLADLPIDVLVAVTEARDAVEVAAPAGESRGAGPATTGMSGAAPGSGPMPRIGWRHPRDTHQAQHTRRVPARQGRPARTRVAGRPLASAWLSPRACAETLHRWGIRTLGALAALPRDDVHARLGDLGLGWQRLACGEDDGPLVPWVAEPVFEASLELEWPVEGFEPLSFVLARLFEPLSAALERADRGAVAIRTALHLTTREVHLRVLPLPAPMRDPKTLRTLVLLDLESHPPAAAVDRVQLRLEPTPGRILQWTLFERAQPAPEQVATLLARLTALMGEGRVGAPALVDSWRSGAFTMREFGAEESAAGDIGRASTASSPGRASAASAPGRVPRAFRRFRLPVPVRVRVEEGRPVRLATDRPGLSGGAIVQAAGPWRTSGEWWASEAAAAARGPGADVLEIPAPVASPLPVRSASWDRDEWDIAMRDGTVYRLCVEREVGQWFLEGIVD